MIDRVDSSLRFHQEALNLRSQRQDVLATNIAHADTPGYKARDFDFSNRLSEAVERGRQASVMPMSVTSARHLSGTAAGGSAGGSAPDLMYRTPTQSSMDGNTVEMDVERVNFADNAMRYEANLTILGSKIKGLLAAVQ